MARYTPVNVSSTTRVLNELNASSMQAIGVPDGKNRDFVEIPMEKMLTVLQVFSGEGSRPPPRPCYREISPRYSDSLIAPVPSPR